MTVCSNQNKIFGGKAGNAVKYVLHVTSVLSAFVMYLVWLFFNKTIRVIHCVYPLKNHCKKNESLLGIPFLES